ncbi:MAG: xanthine dehydrogenase family protein subunit M [Pirellulales bacterium]
MKDFDYAAPTTVDDAVGLLARHDGRAKLLAGGTDLIVQLREFLREADVVVDVKKIPELMNLRVESDGRLWIGAGVPCYRIYGDEKIAATRGGLVDAARIIGGWQIQSRASIGGNLCNSSPAADSIPALIAAAAVCHVAGPGGRRTVPVAEFCTAPGKNVLAAGEMLVNIELPPTAAKSASAYERFIPRNEMDIAVVGAGSWVRLDESGKSIAEARIGIGAVAPTPLLAAEASQWLAGKPATEETFVQAGELAKKIAKPISDMRGPAEYRTHLVGVLVRRTLVTAARRAAS